jgi:hypothetical protein
MFTRDCLTFFGRNFLRWRQLFDWGSRPKAMFIEMKGTS